MSAKFKNSKGVSGSDSKRNLVREIQEIQRGILGRGNSRNSKRNFGEVLFCGLVGMRALAFGAWEDPTRFAER